MSNISFPNLRKHFNKDMNCLKTIKKKIMGRIKENKQKEKCSQSSRQRYKNILKIYWMMMNQKLLP